jgi:DNA topoisomerase 2-associated protein PAT1
MSVFYFSQTDLDKTPEDVAVYTWGEESYDGLGDVLQEGGDELNDETFGSVGAVGEIQRPIHVFCSDSKFK